MKAELISIGDELLIGQTINTNVSWLGMELSLMGISVERSVVIKDDGVAIKREIDSALQQNDIVIVTGGLGPTKDDITKHILCDYFQTELEIVPYVLERVQKFFKDRGRDMLEVNTLQAALPKSCKVLDNLQGTASGMWFEKDGSVLISLPGVPYEMKGIMTQFGFEELRKYFNVASIYHETVLLQGIGESYLADRMQDWEDDIRQSGFGLAYLPSVGSLKLRITSTKGEEDKLKIKSFFDVLKKELPQYVFGDEKDTLSSVIGQLLKENNYTIGTVESCTSGALANEITKTPGASSYFQGSFLTYSNYLKESIVGVSKELIENNGAVSKEVAEQMALFGAQKLGVDICVSTTGIAGPDGGSKEKPVGTIWIGISIKGVVKSYCFLFGDNRERNIHMTVLTALNLLRCNLLEISIEKK